MIDDEISAALFTADELEAIREDAKKHWFPAFKMELQVRPAPVVTIPNVPLTRVCHFGGKGRYHLPAVGFIVRSREQKLDGD